MKNQHTTAEFQISIGEIVSGEKLVDSEEFRNDLKLRFPDAVGGEMEASGMAAAATRLKKEWIVIKAICDWGVGKKSRHQKEAAQNAAAFAIKVVTQVLDAESNRITQ